MSSLRLSSGIGDHSPLEIKMLYYPFSLHKTFKSIIIVLKNGPQTGFGINLAPQW